MHDWLARIRENAVVSHVLRAIDRYDTRLGVQFAAGIAYYSVLALLPVLMLVFSALGLTLKVMQPNLLIEVEAAIAGVLGQDHEITRQIMQQIDVSLNNWAYIGMAGVVIALWIGSAWMGSLKRAVRVQLRPELGQPEDRLPMPLDLLANLGILVVLIIGVAVTFGATWITLSFGAQFGLSRGISVPVSVVAGVLIFWLMLRIFSVEPLPAKAIWEGSLIGAVGLGILQIVATELILVLRNNFSAVTFGSVIILMIFMNLFASLILLVAAWVGTWQDMAAIRAAEEAAANEDTGEIPVLPPAADSQRIVPVEVAERAMKLGVKTGYIAGAATGIGLGAVIAWVLGRRRK